MKGNKRFISQIMKKRMIFAPMIAITKSEKDAIRQKFPSVHIVRTMKQRSDRHRYYCEETTPVLRYLNEIRYPNCVTAFSGKDVRSADRAKRKRVAS